MDRNNITGSPLVGEFGVLDMEEFPMLPISPVQRKNSAVVSLLAKFNSFLEHVQLQQDGETNSPRTKARASEL